MVKILSWGHSSTRLIRLSAKYLAANCSIVNDVPFELLSLDIIAFEEHKND